MAAIVCVHGTNATGPEEGAQWWQRGSVFARDVQTYVEAEDGRLDFKPFVWDGKNSETSRRRGARNLLRAARMLEGDKTHYCLIGHSHGGSVIGHFLLQTVAQKMAVDYLSRWVTVATPFIHLIRNKFLFSRLGLTGKAAYLTALSFSLAAVWWLVIMEGDRENEFPTTTFWIAVTVATILGPFLLFLATAWLLNKINNRAHVLSIPPRLAEPIEARWVSLFHGNDEAMAGLHSIERLNVTIFGKAFAANQVLLLAMAVVPLILLTVGYRGLTYQYLIQPWAERFNEWANHQINPALYDLFQTYGLAFYIPYVVFALCLAVLFVFVLAIILLVLLTPLSFALSFLLSRMLNRVTMAQLRQSAFGNDTRGETAIRSRSTPIWSTREFLPLPDEISEQLSEQANAAASASVAKFRQAVGKLAFSLSDESRQATISEYMSWDELIHTAYFTVPIFRKLVCCAIADSPGFRPSQALKADPDYEKLRQWLEEINRPCEATV